MCLGSHSRITSLGEIEKLGRNYSSGVLCSCGESLRDCVFWANVGEKLRRDSVSLEDIELNPSETGSFERINTLLLNAVSAVAGKTILIDSSKSVPRLKQYLECGDIDIKVIYLIRHPLGLAGSYHKRGGRNGLRKVLQWTQHDKRVRHLLREKSTSSEHVTVRYEDFSSDPEGNLRRLTEWIGVPFESAQLKYYETVHHTAHGNPLRLSLHEHRPIAPDMAWTDRVSPIERIYTRLTAGRLLARLGYRAPILAKNDWVLPWQDPH